MPDSKEKSLSNNLVASFPNQPDFPDEQVRLVDMETCVQYMFSGGLSGSVPKSDKAKIAELKSIQKKQGSKTKTKDE